MKYYFMAFTAMLLLGTLAYRFFLSHTNSARLGLTAGIPISPVIVPDGGTFKRSVTVSIELGIGTIRYTADGQSPSCSNGTVYDGPFTITRTTTVRAIDCAMGSQSLEAHADFIIDSSSKGGGKTINPTEIPYGPTCDSDPQVCPPSAPVDGKIYDLPDQPVYANVIASGHSPFYRDLTFGSVGEDVAVLQQILIDRNFGDHAALRSSGPTGYFGPLTVHALSDLQQMLGVRPAAGYFGPVTRGEINAFMGWLPRTIR